MKKHSLFFSGFGISFILFLLSCTKVKLNKDVPGCIEKKIIKIKKQKVQNPPAQVWEWKINDEYFYYFTTGCCDQYNTLYDAACNYVCAPDGGFSGNGDGNCPPLPVNMEKTLIWQDSRKY